MVPAIVSVPPRETGAPLIVIELLVSALFGIFVRVFDDPEIVLFVKTSDPVSDAFVDRDVAIVDAKFASSFKAAANSLSVFNAVGAASITALTAVDTEFVT